MMTMTDGEIKEAMEAGDLVIENWEEEALEPASYDFRIGGPVQKGGEDAPTDLAATGTVTIRPGEFFLFRTHEKLRVSPRISGHLGPKCYFVRRGLFLLCGQHIDPGFEGYLLMGAYNASPRDVVVRYLDRICNVEFHRLAREPTKKTREFPELQSGDIPRDVRDYFLGIEPVSLYAMSQSISAMAENVASLTQRVDSLAKITWQFVVPVLTGTFLVALAAVIGLLVKLYAE